MSRFFSLISFSNGSRRSISARDAESSVCAIVSSAIEASRCVLIVSS